MAPTIIDVVSSCLDDSTTEDPEVKTSLVVDSDTIGPGVVMTSVADGDADRESVAARELELPLFVVLASSSGVLLGESVCNVV